MKKISWFFLLGLVAFACQVQDEATLSKNASGRTAAVTLQGPGGYIVNSSSSVDGKVFTITIDQSAAGVKNISHILFKFNSCDGVALGAGNIISFTANGADMMSKVGGTDGKGGGNSCYGMYADPFVKLDQGFSDGIVTLVITLDTKSSGGTFVIKAGTEKSGAGCFGEYTFTHDCTIAPPKCYQDETGWATGARYVSRGNWATYTAYQEGTVNVYAGQNMFAGTATMSAVSGGNVTITIALNSDWVLQDLAVQPNPVKIQGYSAPPSGNPSPGRFASKGTSLTVTLPAAAYYGIHLDLRHAVQCPN